MSIFGSIMGKIFGGAAHAQTATQPTPPQGGGAPAPATPTGQNAPPSSSSSPSQNVSPSGTAPQASVDVAAILDDHVSKSGQTLDWRRSIVDLMKGD